MKLSEFMAMFRRSGHEITHCQAFEHSMRWEKVTNRWVCNVYPAWCKPMDTQVPRAIYARLE